MFNHHRIAKLELTQALIALFVAIGLQIVVWKINHELLVGPQYLIIPTELALAVMIGYTVNRHTAPEPGIHHGAAIGLLGLISIANIGSLVLVLGSLISGDSSVTGSDLLTSAVVIFITNIIVFSLWYWEIDSPGLSRTKWSKSTQDFVFTQQELKTAGWEPEFLDYLYLSLTNAVNFAPADTRPVTHVAKLLMGAQALVSVFTLALVIARAVSILGT